MDNDVDVLRDVLLPKFSELGGVRKTGAGWDVRCPVHDDRRASLSVGYGKEQLVVIHCQAGCDPVDVLSAIGEDYSTICMPREQRQQGEWTPYGEAVACYDYVDEASQLLFQVCRTADKTFPQRVPDSTRKSGWRYKLDSTRRVLYRLPKVIAAVADGEVIYVAEGEKDVHALERAGVTATCNPGGAGKWRPEYSEVLRDATVRIVADADKAGQDHARQVLSFLKDVVASAEIVEAAVGKDAADHLAAGKTLDEFLVTTRLQDARPVLAPDLYAFLAEADPAEDWVIKGLLERGDRLIWTGREGLGKTTMSRQLAVCAAAGIDPFRNLILPPQRVLFIDAENPPRLSRRRFRYLAEIAEFFRRPVPEGGLHLIHRPEGIDLTREEEAVWLAERFSAHHPDLVVVGPLYKLHVADTAEEPAARAIVSVLDWVRTQADCALIVEAHAPHGALRPIGSSLFLRWPDHGYGIQRRNNGKDPNKRRVEVCPWRGAREERDWPRWLRWGHQDCEWPWTVDEEGDGDGDH